jgi:hypothetical protein
VSAIISFVVGFIIQNHSPHLSNSQTDAQTSPSKHGKETYFHVALISLV